MSTSVKLGPGCDREALRRLVAAGNSMKHNQFRVGRDGSVRLVDGIQAVRAPADPEDLFISRIFDPTDPWVGPQAAADEALLDRYRQMLEANWPQPRAAVVELP